ncbi:hypothetical protein OG205_27120 [Lentzea sp. NBC_00516]|uniref:hypothetical protein n=1 Tax=Lentzea sp. NBC_00516 TaxID=2903582 RepID=UPI002E81D10B|nr:hypothetical protein [Lentzea sp. NBC_00516]WUD21779.1 hypothetical protein OG205_27120 [Lentzea sp. NBC_00516]
MRITGTGIPHFDTKAEIERRLAAHHPHRTVPGPAEFAEFGWHSCAAWLTHVKARQLPR